jgi:hypothetical protein
MDWTLSPSTRPALVLDTVVMSFLVHFLLVTADTFSLKAARQCHVQTKPLSHQGRTAVLHATISLEKFGKVDYVPVIHRSKHSGQTRNQTLILKLKYALAVIIAFVFSNSEAVDIFSSSFILVPVAASKCPAFLWCTSLRRTFF